MASHGTLRPASREELGLTEGEFTLLSRLDSPQIIQLFLNSIPINFEIGGETLLSVREVLKQRRAHCIEAAFVAACALWMHGEPPLVMHLDCDMSDDPHVLALFRRKGAWGALSKSNGAHLRYRDPIYRSLRELALSFFHEYFNKHGQKTLRAYSTSFDMRRIDPRLWVTCRTDCTDANARLAGLRHYALMAQAQVRLLSPRDAFEQRAAKTVEYPRAARRGQ